MLCVLDLLKKYLEFDYHPLTVFDTECSPQAGEGMMKQLPHQVRRVTSIRTGGSSLASSSEFRQPIDIGWERSI